MTFQSLLRFCGLVFILLSDYAFAALPPKSTEMLKQISTLIVTGTVKEIRTKDVEEGNFIKTYYYIEVGVKEIEKGSIDNKKNQIEAVGWLIKKSPKGWAGPSGVNGVSELKKNAEVRLYLNGNKIIEPNGLQILDTNRKENK